MIVAAADASDIRAVGGKAAALSDLSRAGFDVPPFAVATPCAFNGDDGLSPTARAALAEALAGIGPGPFAVRSSGREEDGAAHSHAGQFLSLLDVAEGEVADAAARVRRSGATETLKAYRASRGLDQEGGAPAVIVQRMVRARAAGVAFSADPVTGRRDRLVVSAIAGLGDRLVGGEENSDDYVLDGPTGAVLERPASGGILSEADLSAVADLAIRAAGHRGGPQDIEWAFEGDRLFLLQARPITTALRAAPTADDTVTVFDNSNIVESYPGLVSPLTYSFAQLVYARVYRAFVALVGVDQAAIRSHAAVFENMLGRVDGRVYYNLPNWYRALALLPGFRINRAHMETMMGVGAPLPEAVAAGIGPPPASGAALLREYARVAGVAVRLGREALRLRRTVRGFQDRLGRALGTAPAEVDAMPLSELAREYRRVESELLDRWDAPLVNDFLCMVAFGASRRLLERWCGEGGLELHNAIMIGQGDIVSAEPARRIARMARLAAGDPAALGALGRGDRAGVPEGGALARELDDYLRRFGDRCTEELKLESVTLTSDPAPLLAAVAAAAGRGGEAPPGAPAVQDPLAAAFQGRPVRRFAARRVVGWAKARVRDRENLRFERTRIFGHARRVFLAMGRQLAAHGALDEERDVLFLTVSEVLGAIEGSGVGADLKGLAALRKAEMARAAERPDPPERIVLAGAAVLNRDNGPARAGAQPSDAGSERRGTGCSAGVVRARARVVRDPRKEALAPGDILVARHTDPGWIAVFSNAAAIVVERGSLLSHSAIVAREMGIPCVVGLKGALDWIADGEAIEVDGARGTVRKVAIDG